MLLIGSLTLILGQQSLAFTRGSSFDGRSVLRSMGTDYMGFVRLSDTVASAVYLDDGLERADRAASNPQDRLDALGRRLRLIADEIQKRENAPRTMLLRQWMFSQACCAYVTSRLDYDWDIVQKPVAVRNRLSEAPYILAQPPGTRKAMCVGFVLLARDLIRSGGEGLNVQATFVGPFSRDLGGQATERSNHCFLGLRMDGGVMVGAELVTPRMALKDFRARRTAPRSDYVMPLTLRDQELFLARNYGADETPPGGTNHGDRQNVFHLSTLSFEEWRGASSAHLREADKAAMADFDRRARWTRTE